MGEWCGGEGVGDLGGGYAYRSLSVGGVVVRRAGDGMGERGRGEKYASGCAWEDTRDGCSSSGRDRDTGGGSGSSRRMGSLDTSGCGESDRGRACGGSPSTISINPSLPRGAASSDTPLPSKACMPANSSSTSIRTSFAVSSPRPSPSPCMPSLLTLLVETGTETEELDNLDERDEKESAVGKKPELGGPGKRSWSWSWTPEFCRE